MRIRERAPLPLFQSFITDMKLESDEIRKDPCGADTVT